jgi:amino acid transporter
MASVTDAERGELSRPKSPVRQKSGLVRAAGAWDSFVFSLSGISVGIMFAWGQLYGTSSYPGGSIVVAMLIAIGASVVIASGYQYWARVFPRSGGDFVFLSRGLHPGVALGANFIFVVILLVSPALAMSIMQPLVSSLCTTLQAALGWGIFGTLSTFFLTNTGFFVVGGVLMVVVVLAGMYGIRGQLRLLQALFITAGVGSVILIVALLLSSKTTFLANIHANVGQSATQIEATAHKNGFVTTGFSLGQTLKIVNWFAPSMFFAMVLVYIGGEIKDVQRTVGRAMRAAVVFSGVLTIVLSLALGGIIPHDLQGALGYNALVVGKATTASVPYPFELMRVLWGTHGGGLVLTLIAYLTMFCWVAIWWAVIVPFTQRAIFAWSLDGLVPRWFSKVHPRTHAAYPALIAVAAVGLGWIIALAYVTSLRTVATLVPVYLLLALTLAVGAAFPFARRSMFAQSPIAHARMLGLPAMTVVCGVGVIVVIAGAVLLWTDPIASGTDRTPIWVFFALAALVTIYYFVLQRFKRHRGVEISSTFDEIPVE